MLQGRRQRSRLGFRPTPVPTRRRRKRDVHRRVPPGGHGHRDSACVDRASMTTPAVPNRTRPHSAFATTLARYTALYGPLGAGRFRRRRGSWCSGSLCPRGADARAYLRRAPAHPSTLAYDATLRATFGVSARTRRARQRLRARSLSRVPPRRWSSRLAVTPPEGSRVLERRVARHNDAIGNVDAAVGKVVVFDVSATS